VCKFVFFLFFIILNKALKYAHSSRTHL